MKNLEKRSNNYTLCSTNESFVKRELPLFSGMTYSYTALSCFQPPESYRYPYDQSPLSPSFLFSSSLLYTPHLHFLLLPLLSFPPISITLYPTPNSPTLYLHCTLDITVSGLLLPLSLLSGLTIYIYIINIYIYIYIYTIFLSLRSFALFLLTLFSFLIDRFVHSMILPFFILNILYRLTILLILYKYMYIPN